jgi:hypothetical protein
VQTNLACSVSATAHDFKARTVQRSNANELAAPVPLAQLGMAQAIMLMQQQQLAIAQ